eukprot:7035365-Pyramimonas_sp.AAC.1
MEMHIDTAKNVYEFAVRKVKHEPGDLLGLVEEVCSRYCRVDQERKTRFHSYPCDRCQEQAFTASH